MDALISEATVKWRGRWCMSVATPAAAYGDVAPPLLEEIGAQCGWRAEALGERWVLLQTLAPSRWSPGVHQAVAAELLRAMVPGIGPHLVGGIDLDEVRVVDPSGAVQAWDLDEVDAEGHLRASWYRGNTSQAANFLANAAASAHSHVLDTVAPDEPEHDLAAGASFADTMFDLG